MKTSIKIITIGFAITFIIIGLWTAGFLSFASSIPTKVYDLETKTDAIVVLTGGSERLKTGVSLLEKGAAKKLFISGVDKRVKIKTLLKSINISSENIANDIVLGYNARNTHENAIETAGWIKGQSFKSLR
ncbi:MAG: YdcF family protein, partial [Alphaproteobacteria bacterium]|nr:YdcF family protein [Alphaproteobacteria bacterium]